MMSKVKLAVLVNAVAFTLVLAPFATAQATRTWVSGVGDDANPCSRTAPCKTFAGAIVKTAAGGEIDALDPGGFGALTITKSITLDGGGGQVASVLVSGTNGIVVAAGATDVVIIRNLRLDGLLGNGGSPGTAGLNGIRFISGKALHIEHCVIFGFNTNGIDVELSAAGQVFVSDTEVTNTFPGSTGSPKPAGVFIKNSGSGIIAAVVERCCIEDGATGVAVDDNSSLTITDSFICGNAVNGVQARADASDTAEANVERCIIANNGAAGVLADQTVAGSTTTVRLSDTMVTDNATGLQKNGSPAGTITSFGNNQIAGNGTDGTPTSTVPQQ